MIHLRPLPGSARYSGDLKNVIDFAVEDSRRLQEGGADGIMVENFFDSPFHKDTVAPVTVAAMTSAVLEIRRTISLPIGINVLRNDVVSAISIASVCGASFVRCNVFVGAAITDQGIIEGAALKACLMRKELGSSVLIFADVGVKHAAILGEYPVDRQAQDAVERGLADAIIATGPATGAATSVSTIQEVRQAAPKIPLLVGSGFDAASAGTLLKFADGAIVGTAIKADGLVTNPVDADRVRQIARAFNNSNILRGNR